MKNFIPMKNIPFVLAVAVSLTIVACQNNAQDDNNANTDMSQTDTVHSGLEGTRDQAATVTGSEVVPDTTLGQSAGTEQTGAQAGTGGLPSGSAKDEKFVSDEIAANIGEINAVKLAQQQSQNAEIKSVASLLEKHHTTALGELKALAAKKKVTEPTDGPADLTEKMKQLDGKKGAAFDKTWCELMSDKHKTAISKYEAASKEVNDPDLRKWINNTLPKLRMHQEKIKACETKLKSA